MTNSEKKIIEIIQKNLCINQILNTFHNFNLNNWYIGGGCITQSVWNYLSNKPINENIKDIDIVYFDEKDLTLEKELEIKYQVKSFYSNISLPIDLKNQARVHLWYEKKFGIPIDPYESTEEAISTWPTTAASIGISKTVNDYKVFSPFGLYDLFERVVRPNKKLVSKDIYIKKTTRWKENWPELTIVQW